MRKNPTVAERDFWKRLRKNRLAGLHFRRQHPIGPYIVDFCCVPKRLVVELDGYSHLDPARVERDEARTLWLRAAGYRVLRFRNEEIWRDLEGVLAAIAKAAGADPQLDGRRGPPLPPPPPEGRGEKNGDLSP